MTSQSTLHQVYKELMGGYLLEEGLNAFRIGAKIHFSEDCVFEQKSFLFLRVVAVLRLIIFKRLASYTFCDHKYSLKSGDKQG